MFISFIGCEQNGSTKNESTKVDSVYFKKVYAEIEYAKNDLKKAISLRDTTIIKDKARLLDLIDTLQSNLKSAHLDQLKLIEIEHKFKIAQVSNKQLIARIDILNRTIENLNDSNIDISDKLKNTSISLNKAKAENDSYKRSIKLAVASVKIKAYGYTHTFLKKPKLIETELAKATKFIEVTFVIVANERLARTTYPLNISIRTLGNKGISKEYLAFFNGEEISTSVKFEDPNEFQIGYHHVDITLKNESLFSGTILLK